MNESTYDPNAGSVGYLTFDQFDRLRRADETAREYVPWLRIAGYLKSGADPDEHRTRHRMAHPPLGVPATWLAAEEISRLSYELNGWASLEDAARDRWGSEVAVLFVREVETAAARWPLEDRSRRVQFFRCTVCNQLTLRYYPPKRVGDRILDLAVKCSDRSCGNVMDAVMFERMAVVIRAEWELRNGKRRLDPGFGSAGSGGEVSEDGLSVGGERGDSDVAAVGDSVAVRAGFAEGGV